MVTGRQADTETKRDNKKSETKEVQPKHATSNTPPQAKAALSKT
jgi:hypothetical protein